MKAVRTVFLSQVSSEGEDGYTYDELIQQINELIKYYRLFVVPKKGSKSEDEDDGGSEDGGSEDGGGSDDGGDTPSPTPSGDDDSGSGYNPIDTGN